MLALLPHAGDVLDACGGHEQRRLRVAHAERPQQFELLRQLEAQLAARHDGVHALDRDQVRGRERRAGVGGERMAKAVDGGRL